jgi:hypothetical protein
LLLGEGPELRQRETTTPEGALLATIAAEFRATEKADHADHEQAWARLALYAPRAILQLEVEAVRPVYQNALRDVEYAQMNAHNLKQVYTAVLRELGEKLDDAHLRARLVELETRAVEQLMKVPPRPMVQHPLRLGVQ